MIRAGFAGCGFLFNLAMVFIIPVALVNPIYERIVFVHSNYEVLVVVEAKRNKIFELKSCAVEQISGFELRAGADGSIPNA